MSITTLHVEGWRKEDGQWWYYAGDGSRRRGREVTCECCGQSFPTRRREERRTRFCSSGCSQRGSIKPPGTVSQEGGYLSEYVAPDDPMLAMRRGRGYRVYQHRLVMARHLGRLLQPHEQVHHINGDRHDNRIENLQLRDGHHGSGRIARCVDCGSSHIVYEELD